MNLILVLNCGSSSIKFRLIDPEIEEVHLKGLAENLTTSRAVLTCDDTSYALLEGSYEEALLKIFELVKTKPISAIGHRVVHGGEHFTTSVKIDESVLKAIESCSHLAPLHNPISALAIKMAAQKFPFLSQVAVFDTAFHQTMPKHAYLYALPYEYYETFQIRKYGFHGTSHRYVTEKAAKMIGKPLESTRFISCHLGNGCSVAAVKGGSCLDTSMGLTPLEGLVMGKRCGDLDPSVLPFLSEKLKISQDEVMTILTQKSGLLGISGISEDMRLLLESRSPRALLATQIFCYRLAKYIAAYLVPLQSVDRVIFTGGIGENAPQIRNMVMEHLDFLSLQPLVVETNEEAMIAKDTMRLLKEKP